MAEDEAYAARRAACGVPAAVGFTTTLVLGWAMIQAVHQAGRLRCRWGACDEAFGRDTTRLDQIAGLGWWDDAEVPHDTRGWLERPATAVPAWAGRGASCGPPRGWRAPSNPKPWLRSLPPCQQGPGRSRRSRRGAKAHAWRRVPPCG